MRKLAILSFALLLTGCTTYTTNPYAISPQTDIALRPLKGSKVQVGQFTSYKPGLARIYCRGAAAITTPQDGPFTDYIRNALVDELQIANLYSPTSSVVLSGHLEYIDFSSVSGDWKIKLKLTSSNGHSLTETEVYSFPSSYFGDAACHEVAQSLMPAVQGLMQKVASDPYFPFLLK